MFCAPGWRVLPGRCRCPELAIGAATGAVGDADRRTVATTGEPEPDHATMTAPNAPSGHPPGRSASDGPAGESGGSTGSAGAGVPAGRGRARQPATTPATTDTRYSWPTKASNTVTARAGRLAGVMSPKPT